MTDAFVVPDGDGWIARLLRPAVVDAASRVRQSTFVPSAISNQSSSSSIR